jgi:CBS domain-containing protein
MRLEDVMTRDLPSVSPADSVRDAARLMAESGVKAMPVCDGDQAAASGARLGGIITDWDITRAAARSDDLSAMPVSEAMTSNVLTAAPGTTLDEASELMGDHRIHHLCISVGGSFRGMVHLDVEWAQLAANVQAPMATFFARV